MPKGNVLLRERTLRRAVRAVQKEGLIPKAVTVAEPILPKVNLPELDGEIEKLAESTWDRDYGKHLVQNEWDKISGSK